MRHSSARRPQSSDRPRSRDGSLRGSYVNHGYRPHFLPKIAPTGLERRFMEIIEVLEQR